VYKKALVGRNSNESNGGSKMCAYRILKGQRQVDVVYMKLCKGKPLPASTVRKLLLAAGRCTADCTVTR
jgi:hypothetical protein